MPGSSRDALPAIVGEYTAVAKSASSGEPSVLPECRRHGRYGHRAGRPVQLGSLRGERRNELGIDERRDVHPAMLAVEADLVVGESADKVCHVASCALFQDGWSRYAAVVLAERPDGGAA